MTAVEGALQADAWLRTAAGETAWLDEAVDGALADLWSAGPGGEDATALELAVRAAAAGGKRFRPRVVAAVHDCLGGGEPAGVASVAAAVELLHTAFVVHDDVIDGDDVRRGRPSVPGGFRGEALGRGAGRAAADTYAVAGAVLTGDLALSAALRVLALAPLARSTTTRLLELVTESLVVSASGELADVRLSLGLGAPSLQEVLDVAERKTAAYSFMLPMRAGAVLAGAPVDVVARVGEVGRLLGVAYQLYDDLAGTFGDPATTGKSDLADLREGKCTSLVLHARGTSWWPLVERHWGDPDLTSADAAEVRALLERAGSRAFVETVAADYLDAGLAEARALQLPVGLLDWLTSLRDRAVGSAA